MKKLGKGGTDQTQLQKSPQSTSPLTTFQISASPNDGVISSHHGSTLSLNSTSPDFYYSNGGSTVRSHSSLSYYSSPAVGKKSPQLAAGDSSQQERSRSLSPASTEDLYSYRKSPLPKHRTPPSVTLSTHRGSNGSTSQTGSSTSQTGFTNCYKEKAQMNGHLQLGTEGIQTSKSHYGIQRQATEINSREMSKLSSSVMLSSSANLAGSCASINHSPSSPDFVESGDQLKRRKDHSHKTALTEHQYSSSPNFFSSSNDSLGVGNSNSNGRGGTSSSLMKLSERHNSSLSLYSIASLSGSSGALVAVGVEDCRQEAAVMDLYILKQSSDFYHQLCVAWVNVKIVSVYIQWNLRTRDTLGTI